MSLDDPELLAEFVAESREHLLDVESQLLEIEAQGADVDLEVVNTVFRAVHSIKGATGFLGLTVINKLAHSLESVLGKLRDRELLPTPDMIGVMLRAVDALARLIHHVETSNSADVSVHTDALNRIYAGEDGAASAAHRGGSSAKPDGGLLEAKPAAGSVLDAAPAEASIRVPVGVLDCLMNLAGELVLGRNQLMQAVSAEGGDGIEAVASRLDHVTTKLQEAIMRTRMQPVGAVFNRFPRLARDLSQQLDKQCEIVIDGKEVEVDKTILEAIGDPLTHLVRNSIDHGIEPPEGRAAAGKRPFGRVALRADHQAGKVRIIVTDDGAGIRPEKLRQKAVARGLVTAEQSSRMSDREAIRLIFQPGFSTAEEVTEISGRGVGMDVVRANIEKLGGTVDIDSVPGCGTTIQITLPLTLAIIPSLIIRSAGQSFAVPQVNVRELVRVRTNELDEHTGRVKNADVLRLRGELLPLVRLEQVLQFSPLERESIACRPVNVIVIESGQRHYGLVVDEIVDSEEIVVKPLGCHVKSCPCLSGATILGDGHVALILDAGGIAVQAELADTQDQRSVINLHAGSSQSSEEDLHDLLLFSTSRDERFAIPMSLVARIERIHSHAIKMVGGRRLLEYRGCSLPLLRLGDHVASAPMPDLDRYFVIVFRAAGREAGLLTPHLGDIRQLALDIDTQSFHQKGITGAFVVDDTTTRLVDVVELAELAHPDWFTELPAVGRPSDSPPVVLIAEDSAFFRRQVSEFLQGKGLRVVECEDGAQAWEYLARQPHEVQLVITDVEMPHMTGFELCRTIKQHAELKRLPVIALTSLASEADKSRGLEAGVDEYQMKMDREKLQEAVARWLRTVPDSPDASGPGAEARSSACLLA